MTIYYTNSPLHQLDLSLLRPFFGVASFGGFSRSARAFTLTKQGLALLTLCQRFEANLKTTLGAFKSAGTIRRRMRIGTALSIGFGPLIPFCVSNAKSMDPYEFEIYPRETPMRAVVDKFCMNHKLRFFASHSANSVDALKLLVTHVAGGAFVLRSLVTEGLKNKTLLAVDLPVDLPLSGVSLATRPGEHGDSVTKFISNALC